MLFRSEDSSVNSVLFLTGGADATITDPSNRWRYSGKEEQQALSPDHSILDYGARMYDPSLARKLELQEPIK